MKQRSAETRVGIFNSKIEDIVLLLRVCKSNGWIPAVIYLFNTTFKVEEEKTIEMLRSQNIPVVVSTPGNVTIINRNIQIAFIGATYSAEEPYHTQGGLVTRLVKGQQRRIRIIGLSPRNLDQVADPNVDYMINDNVFSQEIADRKLRKEFYSKLKSGN